MAQSLPLENFQRVGILAYIPQLLRKLHVDPAQVLSEAGLSPDALRDPDGTIPYVQMGLLLHIAAEKTGRPDFGLQIGRQLRTHSLGPVGELMRNAPTLGVALQDFATHQHRNAHGSIVYLLDNFDHAILGYAVYQPNVPGAEIICDAAASAGYSLLPELVGRVSPADFEVLLCRPKPIDPNPYNSSFGAKLLFAAKQTAIMFPCRLLDSPIQGADLHRRAELERHVASIRLVGELDTLTQLRRLLTVELLRGQVSGEEVSMQLGVSLRTLNRRLEAWGLGFQEVLDQTRCNFTQQLLANTRLSITEIAEIVGYADPSVLTRAFTRWTGVPPSNWRAMQV